MATGPRAAVNRRAVPAFMMIPEIGWLTSCAMEAVISPSKARRSSRPVAGGRSRLEMKNQNGVQVYLTSASKGLDVSLGRGGVEMSLKKEASSST